MECEIEGGTEFDSTEVGAAAGEALCMSERAVDWLPAAPLIVVTTSSPRQALEVDAARREVARYEAAVRRHGGNPVVVDAATPKVERDARFRAMAGLLLTGGADLDPGLYGEAIAGSGEVDRRRDQLELVAWKAATENDVAVLGICRGLQAINVFAGGSLVQHLPDHAGAPEGSSTVHTHDMWIDRESLLARSLAAGTPPGQPVRADQSGRIELKVNTFHHQAVTPSRLAPGLRAVGWASSSEGPIIEGVESDNHRWIVGIQCHPEMTESTPDEFEGLFAAFIDAAREAAQQPGLRVGRSTDVRG
jgi:putative glutamine amidotransferase